MNRPKLSEREFQLLELAAQGQTDQGIANTLGISVGTVGTYWGRIRIKMGPLPRAELVAKHIQWSTAENLAALKATNDQLAEHLAKAAAKAKEAEQELEHLQVLLDHAPDAVLFVDKRGVILRGNAAAAELFHVDISAFPGTEISHFIPEHLHSVHREHRERYFQNPARAAMGDHKGVVAQTINGQPIRLEATVNLAPTPSGEIAIVFIRPSRHH